MYDPRVEKKSGPLPTQTRVLPVIRSTELLRGGRELCIEHLGQRYRLCLTRNGKLILVK